MKKFAGKWKAEIDPNKIIDPVVRSPHVRSTNVPKPVSGKFEPAVAAKPVQQQYTGDAMIGVATMHKSNSVPVFNPDHAVELARMRRS